MKRLLICLVMAAFAVAAISPGTMAAANADAKILLHLRPITTKNACTTWGMPAGCQAIVTNGDLVPNYYYAYVLITDGNATAGLAGLQFGIQYNNAPGAGVDVYSWALCATLEFQTPTPVWPASGGGNLITWDASTKCQRTEPGGPGTGVIAVAGYFYCGAYSQDMFAIVPRPIDHAAKVADCQAIEDIVPYLDDSDASHLGFLSFSANGLAPGFNPCGIVTPVEKTTWSAVKAAYAR